MLIGSHVSMKGKEMLLGAAREAFSYDENTFMIYTGAPQNTRRKPIDELMIPQGQEFMKEHGLSHIVVHAPYVINLANNKDEDKYQFTIDFLRDEIQRAEAIGAHQITLHPGSHVGLGVEKGIENIIYGLNEAMYDGQRTQIALETMAGKGTEIGRTFEEIAAIIDGCKYADKLSVTIDTCHMNDAGYDVRSNFDGVLDEFNHVIGIDRIKVVHLNDSQNPQGSHKDRHANIGMGTIGFEPLYHVAHHPKLKDVPKILETPFINRNTKDAKAPYPIEIEMLKSGHFNPEALKNEE